MAKSFSICMLLDSKIPGGRFLRKPAAFRSRPPTASLSTIPVARPLASRLIAASVIFSMPVISIALLFR